MTALYDTSTEKSRTGYVTMFADCPIVWCSKLQTLVALSSTESYHVALSEYLREVIYNVQFLHKLNEKGSLFILRSLISSIRILRTTTDL